MNSLDFLHYALGVGFVVLTGFLSYMTYEAAQVFKSVKVLIDRFDGIIENVEDVTLSVKAIKDNLKIESLNILSKILKYFFSDKSQNKKGGED